MIQLNLTNPIVNDIPCKIPIVNDIPLLIG